MKLEGVGEVPVRLLPAAERRGQQACAAAGGTERPERVQGHLVAQRLDPVQQEGRRATVGQPGCDLGPDDQRAQLHGVARQRREVITGLLAEQLGGAL